MLVLGIDTSTKVGGLGIFDSERGLIGESNLALERTHSERLMPLLAELLQSVDLQVQDLDGFAVTLGPGSFTGTRIGVTTAKTLAQMTDKPIKGVSTIEVTAYNLALVPELIYPIFDARNRRVYTGGFRGGREGISRITEDLGCSIDELMDNLQNLVEPVYFLGDAIEKYSQILWDKLGSRVIIPPAALWMPRGGVVAELGAKKLIEDEADDLFGLTPNYLKPSQAEINWAQKHGK